MVGGGIARVSLSVARLLPLIHELLLEPQLRRAIQDQLHLLDLLLARPRLHIRRGFSLRA
jgi:hypothetical protein